MSFWAWTKLSGVSLEIRMDRRQMEEAAQRFYIFDIIERRKGKGALRFTYGTV